jgi:hypothetical protein
MGEINDVVGHIKSITPKEGGKTNNNHNPLDTQYDSEGFAIATGEVPDWVNRETVFADQSQPNTENDNNQNEVELENSESSITLQPSNQPKSMPEDNQEEGKEIVSEETQEIFDNKQVYQEDGCFNYDERNILNQQKEDDYEEFKINSEKKMGRYDERPPHNEEKANLLNAEKEEVMEEDNQQSIPSEIVHQPNIDFHQKPHSQQDNKNINTEEENSGIEIEAILMKENVKETKPPHRKIKEWDTKNKHNMHPGTYKTEDLAAIQPPTSNKNIR